MDTLNMDADSKWTIYSKSK